MRRGHVGEISALALSPDGKLLATGGDDYQVKLWDVETGRMLRTLNGHEDEVMSVKFSRSGNFLITLERESAAQILWNVRTGDNIKKVFDHFTDFSHDERSIAYIETVETKKNEEKKFLRVISLPSGEIVKSLKIETLSFPRAFSFDDAFISVEQDGGTTLFNIKQGKFTGRFDGDFVSFLPDGGVLTLTPPRLARLTAQPAAGQTPQGTLICGSIGKTEERFRVTGLLAGVFREAVVSPDRRIVAGLVSPNTVNLWSTRNGKLLRTLKTSKATHGLEFSPDGSVLIAQNLVSITDSFDTRTGKLLATFKSPWFKALNNDGSLVAVFDDLPQKGSPAKPGEPDYKAVKVLDVRSGRLVARFAPGATDSDEAVFSHDGKLIVSTAAGHVDVWNINSNTLSMRFDRAPDQNPTVTFSDDWKSLTLTSGTTTVTLGQSKRLNFDDSSSSSNIVLRENSKNIEFYDRTSDRIVRTLPNRPYWMSADKRRVAINMSGERYLTDVWDLESNRLLRTLPGDLEGITPNGKVVVTTVYGSGKSVSKLWDADSGSSLGRMNIADLVEFAAFSPDSKMIAVAQGGNGRRGLRYMSIYSAETGALIREQMGEGNFSAAFSPDSQTVALGGYYGTVELYEVRTGTFIKDFQDMGSSLPVAFNANGQILATYNSESGVRLWAVQTGELLGSIVQFDGDNWLAVTPEGLFDGTPGAWSQILWRFSRDTFDVVPVETFFSDFYSPGLVTDLLAGNKPLAPRNIADLDRRQTKLTLTLVGQDPSQPIASRSVNVQVQVSEAPAGARDLRLFRNGTLVKRWRGALPLVNGQATLETSIKLVAGENRIAAYAFNNDNVKSLDASLVCNGADTLKRKPTAYIFAIGVNDYSNEELNLKFAKADALAFSEQLLQRQVNLNQFDQIKVVSLLDNDSTKANMLGGLNRLSSNSSQSRGQLSASALDQLQPAEPEDTVVIYFAGHGTAFRDQFYLIPTDIDYTGRRRDIGEENIACILNRSISDRELEVALEGVEAKNILMVIDSCNSGQMLEAEEKRRGPMNSKGLAQLAYEKGMFILTAAQSYQAALEADKLGHGFLTFALVLEGLESRKADFDPKDGEITAREWLDYASERVPQLQAEKMQQGRLLNHDVVFATGEEGEYDLKKRSVQVPRVFYRREIEPSRFIIAK